MRGENELRIEKFWKESSLRTVGPFSLILFTLVEIWIYDLRQLVVDALKFIWGDRMNFSGVRVLQSPGIRKLTDEATAWGLKILILFLCHFFQKIIDPTAALIFARYYRYV